MASKAPFALSRATEEDLAEIVDLQFRCFPLELCKLFMGTESEADLPKLRDWYAGHMKEDNSLVWIKVVDNETGKIIAASEWKVNVSQSPVHPDQPSPPWLTGELEEASVNLHDTMNSSRKQAMTGPFVYLHICFTDEKYRRRGAGGMMLQWGIDIADLLHLPGWIEASPDGNALYKLYGFCDVGEFSVGFMDIVNMKRDAKKVALLGGK